MSDYRAHLPLATSVAFASLRPVVTIGAVFYSFFALVVQFAAEPPGATRVALLAGVIALSMMVLRLLLHASTADRLEPYALAIVTFLALSCLAIPVLVFSLTEVAYPAVGLTVIIVAMGAVIHHRPLFMLLLAIALSIWLGGLMMFPPPIPWVQVAVEVAIVTAGSLMVHGVTHRVVGSLDAARRELERQATTDELTGLTNGRGLDLQGPRYLAQARAKGNPVAVLYVDMDELKRVNDAGGHQIGDDHIRRVAHVLRDHTRPSDLLARVGGDEFVMMCESFDDDRAHALRRRLEAALDAAGLPASVGVAIADQQMSLREVTHDADRQMYRAKHARRQARMSAGLEDS